MASSMNMTMDDIFSHQHFTIIKLSGINKIMAKAGIDVTYQVEGCDAKYAAVKCQATNPDGQQITTLAAHALRTVRARTIWRWQRSGPRAGPS